VKGIEPSFRRTPLHTSSNPFIYQHLFDIAGLVSYIKLHRKATLENSLKEQDMRKRVSYGLEISKGKFAVLVDKI
jgi:hypothetical protein